MIECVWIRIRDGADPMEVLQRAHDAMGDDGDIFALKPEREGEGLTWNKSTIIPPGPDFIIRRG